MADLRDQLLQLLPDGPTTVQMRALLELGETQLFGEVEGAAFAHAEAQLGVLHGRPTAKTLHEFRLACGQPRELLASAPVEVDGYDWAPLSLSSRERRFVPSELIELTERPPFSPSSVEGLSQGDTERSQRGHFRPLARAGSSTLLGENGISNPASGVEGLLVHSSQSRLTPELWSKVSPSLSASLANVMERRAVFCAQVDGQPVCFAWAPLRSEGWFDVWVQTLPEFRRRGLGQRVASALMQHERTEGRSPVWCAADSESLGLGESLGFVEFTQSLWRARLGPSPFIR
jgi:GNAT superfamily N-acetyltransferase